MPSRLRTWLARRPLTLTIAFYGLAMLLPALLLRGLWFETWIYIDDLTAPSPAPLLVAIGGTALLLAGTPWVMRFDWARRVAEVVGRVFGPLTAGQAVWLGAASGIGEELLFRGALQPMIGLLPAAIVFALLHCIGRWWLFALIMGLALGALYNWSGNLWPCVVAHAMLNAVNLYRLSRLGPEPG